MIKIRKSTKADLPTLHKMMKDAINQLKNEGIDQWQNGYPDLDQIINDQIRQSNYVLETNKELLAATTIQFAEDLSYKDIDGSWINDDPYMTLHRVFVNDEFKGKGVASKLFSECEGICRKKGYCSIRIDTHPKNYRMKRALTKSGFKYCGRIKLSSGVDKGKIREAYQLIVH